MSDHPQDRDPSADRRRPATPPVIDDFDAALRARRRLLPRFDEADDDEPSPDLDRLVLDRARDALRRERTPPERHYRGPRWAAPVALAATVLLSFGVVTQMDPTRNDAVLSQPAATPQPGRASAVADGDERVEAATEPAMPSSLSPAPESASAPEAASAMAPARAPAPAPRASAPAPTAMAELRDAEAPAPAIDANARSVTPAAPAPASASAPASAQAPAPAPASAPRASADATRFRESRSAGALAEMSAPAAVDTEAAASQPLGKSAPAPAAAVAVRATPLNREDPQRWLEGIERLRRAGELDAARNELAAFVEQHPELPLPPALQALR